MSNGIEVGTPVTFKAGDALVRKGTYTGSGMRTWVSMRDGAPRGSYQSDDFMEKPRTGFIVGQRTLSNGAFSKGWSKMDYFGEWDGEPDVYQIHETFQAYLVVESLRSAPIKIRVEDVEVQS